MNEAPISFKWEGVSRLSERVTRAHAKLTDRKRLNANAVTLVDKWIQGNFRSEGAPVGGWTVISSATIAAKKSSKILHDEGRLRSDWKHISDGSIAAIESERDYSRKHDEGLGNMPKRQILPSEEHVIKQLTTLFESFVRKAIR